MSFIKEHLQNVKSVDIEQLLDAANYVNQVAPDKRTDMVAVGVEKHGEEETLVSVHYTNPKALFALAFYFGAFVQRKARYPITE